jgi:hypothetical protein
MIALGAQAGESFYSRGGLGMHNGGLRGASGTRSFRYVGIGHLRCGRCARRGKILMHAPRNRTRSQTLGYLGNHPNLSCGSGRLEGADGW